ncbi:MAG TPA: PIN domain-containing protein [Tepidisphaeraceae bacterium]|jgi:predicted nucleic acid-binding protein|nr:PIN domain-containing protein [Tepidisphaeraceae bacterium]
MYLVDTNVWIESLLLQANANEADQFFRSISPRELLITDFSTHSIILKLHRLNMHAKAVEFADDLLLAPQVTVITILPSHLPSVLKCMLSTGLDYDDAYQYVAAEANNATIVTFDADFTKTPRGGKSPGQAVAERRTTPGSP